jgi:hypothetical protein
LSQRYFAISSYILTINISKQSGVIRSMTPRTVNGQYPKITSLYGVSQNHKVPSERDGSPDAGHATMLSLGHGIAWVHRRLYPRSMVIRLSVFPHHDNQYTMLTPPDTNSAVTVIYSTAAGQEMRVLV